MDALKRDYKICEIIGSGGFGHVYSAIHNETQTSVAIKQFQPSRFENGVPREIVMLEKSSTIDGVVQLINTYQLDEQTFAIVLSKPENCCDLYDYLETFGSLPEPLARQIFGDVVEIVRNMFKIGIVHLDIKDENIIIDKETNKVTLVDFGAADRVRDGEYTEFSGTMFYAPPEFTAFGKFKAEPFTVWTLGALLFSMLVGREIDNSLHIPDCLSDDAKNLLSGMLQSNPQCRMSMEDIVNHPFML